MEKRHFRKDKGGQVEQDKPPFRIPSMQEIRGMEWNGYKCVSTFSGGGGSSTGYKMAGFKVLWANEFIPAAQDTYRKNHPDTILDTRDIREISPESILAATGLRSGELDLFDGSPPCASFSMAGKRQEGWGTVKKYSDTEQRTDDLFYEYIRLVKGVCPKVFVAENVSGLVKGAAKGYFLRILAAMKEIGYDVECRTLDAQWLGVPQTRVRAIFIGVRKDLSVRPVFPSPLPYRYTIKDALPGIWKAYHDTAGQHSIGEVTDRPCPTVTTNQHLFVETGKSRGFGDENWNDASKEVCGTIGTSPSFGNGLSPSGAIRVNGVRRKFTIQELKAICGFPPDYELTGTTAKQWERLGRAVPPVMMSHIAATVRDRILPLCAV